MKRRHIIALAALLAILTALQVSTHAEAVQDVSEASPGFDPEKVKLISDTILEIVKDWWGTLFLPILIPLFFPKVWNKIGRGMASTGRGIESAGDKLQKHNPKEK